MTNTTTKTAILTGDTYSYRTQLKAHGWRWDADRKAWTLDVDADATEADVISRDVRALSGIRNRGDFSVEFDS